MELTRMACLSLLFTRCRNLYLLIDIMPISEPEKKADRQIRKNNKTNKVERGSCTEYPYTFKNDKLYNRTWCFVVGAEMMPLL